jgi:tryptophanyl-tRNA synthetase
LGKRRLGHQKRGADLSGRQATDKSQGERHLAVAIERWVAAQEKETEAFVFIAARLGI